MAVQDPRLSIGSVTGARAGAPAIDQGLRAFMLAVYNHMAIGVALTAAAALGTFMLATGSTDGNVTSLTSFGQMIYHSPLKYVVMFSPFALVLWMSFGAGRMSAATARTLFYVYSATMGISLSFIFLVYTGGSVARVFAVTAATFGALSLYGYTTKRDLTGFGSFLMMGLFGLIIASVVNIFLGWSTLSFITSVGGVLIFAGLTAWDTQMLKTMYSGSNGGEETNKLAIYGALNLYMDFLNIFLSLLQLLGDRR
jgi:FtsH-binding integral membrane protein